ncbi:MAG: LuxR C-terminal-related transcriptional regulator [Rhizobiaceae bacterium]
MSNTKPTMVGKTKGRANLLGNLPSEERPHQKSQSKLTHLERDTLWRLSIGDTKDIVAQDLSLSERTIDILIGSATLKLGANSTIHAVSILLRNGDLGITR